MSLAKGVVMVSVHWKRGVCWMGALICGLMYCDLRLVFGEAAAVVALMIVLAAAAVGLLGTTTKEEKKHVLSSVFLTAALMTWGTLFGQIANPTSDVPPEILKTGQRLSLWLDGDKAPRWRSTLLVMVAMTSTAIFVHALPMRKR